MCDQCERAASELIEVATAQMEQLPNVGGCPSMLLLWAALRAAREEGSSFNLAHIMLRLGRDGVIDAGGCGQQEHLAGSSPLEILNGVR